MGFCGSVCGGRENARWNETSTAERNKGTSTVAMVRFLSYNTLQPPTRISSDHYSNLQLQGSKMSDHLTKWNGTVVVDERTEYTRTNTHAKIPFDQEMVAITMISQDGDTVLTTYTDVDTKFAQSVNVGDELTIGCKVSEKTDEFGSRLVARNCRVGGFVGDNKAAKAKASRKAKWLAKLAK